GFLDCRSSPPTRTLSRSSLGSSCRWRHAAIASTAGMCPNMFPLTSHSAKIMRSKKATGLLGGRREGRKMSTFAIIVSTIFRLTMVATIAIGISSGSGREKFLEEGTVSWRGLDFVFILLLMVSETYTSFSFLGTAGWSNSYGVPIFYLIGYLSIALIVAYLVGPLFWTYAARHKLISLSEIVE